MGIRMEVKLTDGYQQRFTSACLAQIGSRKEVTKIEDGNEGRKDHADRSGQHTDGDHKILEIIQSHGSRSYSADIIASGSEDKSRTTT